MSPDPAPVPRAAAWLGGLGLVPFVAGAAGVWLLETPRHEAAVFLLRAYAAVILAFMGAIHWGLAMAQGVAGAGAARGMALSVLPALLAWFALSLPPVAALAVMGAGFVGVYALDDGAIRAGRAPAWYRRLRVPLTLAVLACLSVSIWGLLSRGSP